MIMNEQFTLCTKYLVKKTIFRIDILSYIDLNTINLLDPTENLDNIISQVSNIIIVIESIIV